MFLTGRLQAERARAPTVPSGERGRGAERDFSRRGKSRGHGKSKANQQQNRIYFDKSIFHCYHIGMLRSFITGLAGLVYPKTCVVCKNKLKNGLSVDDFVCFGCWEKITRNTPPFCHCCGRHLDKNNVAKNMCPSCIKTKVHFDRAFSPCAYLGTIKELIHAFKYQNKDYLGETLSKLMIDFINEYNLPVNFIDLILPVPLHSARMRQREYNQAQILSRHIAAKFNKPVLDGVLIRHRNTKTQTDLNIHQRLNNVAGSFSLRNKERIKNKDILLVDDVMTTGSTVSEAAYTLKSAGARLVFVLTLAN